MPKKLSSPKKTVIAKKTVILSVSERSLEATFEAKFTRSFAYAQDDNVCVFGN